MLRVIEQKTIQCALRLGSSVAHIQRAVRVFWQTTLAVSSKRDMAIMQMEQNILKSGDVLAEWQNALAVGAVCRPETDCSKRHWEKACKEFRDVLHKFKDERLAGPRV